VRARDEHQTRYFRGFRWTNVLRLEFAEVRDARFDNQTYGRGALDLAFQKFESFGRKLIVQILAIGIHLGSARSGEDGAYEYRDNGPSESERHEH